MSATVLSEAQSPDVSDGLLRLAELPDWLRAALDAGQVVDALRCHVPEFASGALKLRGGKVKRLVLKDDQGHWSGTYNLTVEEPESGQQRAVALYGTLTAPLLRQTNGVEQAAPAAFGAAGWHCTLPELGLELELEPPDTALAAVPQLTDPELSRELLEQGIRASSPGYHDLRIAGCTPEVLVYKPGSRCIIRYHLTYPAEQAGRGWPAELIAKTYRKDSKTRNAYDGMLALWASPLAAGDVVTIAEPLAYVSELKLMVQTTIAEELTLEEMLKSALASGAPEALEQLSDYMRKAAAGLAALHRSGICHGETITWESRIAEIPQLLARLSAAVPALADAATPLLARLASLNAEHPADPAVPTHGTFNPEQVLIDRGRIGFIDFDDFCMAEPALDVGLFRAAIKDTGLNALDKRAQGSREARLARLALLDQICDVFLVEYEAHAPISRQRVALWETWSYLRDSLHYWIKVKPAEPDNALLTLEQHLRGMGLYDAPAAERKTAKAADSLIMSFLGGALLSAAFYASSPVFLVLLLLLAVASLVAGRAAWRQVIGQIDGYPRAQRLGTAGALGFIISALAVTLSLAELEPLALATVQGLPAYLQLILLFAPAAFIVTAVTGAALGLALRSRRASAIMGLAGGLAAMLAFVAVDLTMDHLGIQPDSLSLVAGPVSLEVLVLSDLGAALASCAVIGIILLYYRATAPDGLRNVRTS